MDSGQGSGSGRLQRKRRRRGVTKPETDGKVPNLTLSYRLGTRKFDEQGLHT